MKRYINMFICLLSALTASAASYTTATIDNITYRLYDEISEAHVYHDKSSTSITVTDNRLELPEKVTSGDKEYTVTEIEYFRCGSTALTLVTPKTVKSVANVKKGVKTLVLGAGVTSVSGLHESEHLEGFEVAEGNESFSLDSYGVLYSKDKTKLYYAPYGKRGSFASYTVPSTVTYIGRSAFYGFNQLETIILPDGLKQIDNYAFYNCTKLINCKLPSTVETIGTYTFFYCNLSGLELPAQLKTIGERAFHCGVENNALASLVIPQYVEKIEDNAFAYVTIEKVTVHCVPFVLSNYDPLGDPSNQTLIVPKGTRDIFSTREGWRRINKVIEGDFEPTFNVADYLPGSTSLDSDGQIITQDGVTYKLYNSGVARVYCYSNYRYNVTAGSTLAIPESVYFRGKNYPVDGVEYFETYNNTIVDLQLPNTVTFVNNVKSGVKILKLPKSVTSVSGLHESINLEGFEVAEDNEYFSVDNNGVLYSKDKTKLYYAPYGKRSSFASYTVPSTVTSIGNSAFREFNQLETVSLPEGLKKIEYDAFYNCTKLINCKLPSTVETIGTYTFFYCNLSGLELPAQLKTIGERAFHCGVENNALASLVIPQYVEKIEDNAFAYVTIEKVTVHCVPFVLSNYDPLGDPSNQTLIVPKGTRDIFSTREGWRRINKVIEGDFEPTFNVADYLPGSTSLDSDGQIITQDGVTYKLYNSGVARVYCYSNYRYNVTAGSTLAIPESVYFRGKNYPVDGVEYFETYNNTIVDLQLPNTVTFVNNVKSGVKILKLPKSVTSVSGLHESINLEGFEVAEGNEYFSVDNFGVLYSKDKKTLWYAPYGKRSSFASYTVPDGVTTISESAFNNFRDLVRVNLPEGLKEIGSYAFYYCDKLVNCKLPSSVETIGSYAFYYCELTGFSLPSKLRTIGDRAFVRGVQNDKLETIEIPQYVEKIGDYAFEYVTIDRIYSWITAENLLPISTHAFSNQSNIPLVVPTGSLETYRLMSGWSTFTVISESDDLLPTTVKCSTPKITRSGNTLTITAEPADAAIYYTTDGREPTANSTSYTSPITPTKNCTVKAIAIKEGLQDSEVATYKVEWFKAEKPTFSLTGDMLTISSETEGASIYYTLGFDAIPSASTGTLYTTPIKLTDNRTVKAVAVKDGYEDSDIAEFTHGSVTCPAPVFEKYDGRYITFKTNVGIEIRYTTDGSTPTKNSTLYDGRAAISGLCTVRAIAFSDVMNPSEETTFEVTYFYTGEQAQLTVAGTLEKAFEWCGTQGMTKLSITGPLNSNDLTFIKTKLNSLQYLDMEKATIADHALPNEAFADMQLIAFTSSKDINSVGERIFAGCQQLAAVVWNASEKLSASIFGDYINPNMLMYVSNKLFAPSGVRNVIANGTASSIVLSDAEGNNNFYCPIAFKAEKISYTHNYSMQTQIGKCMGWETISLPFSVQKITHESKGEIIPFKKLEAEGNLEDARPFWLRELTDTGFDDAASIEANKPYIISMPNSTEYAARYLLAGKVTFSAEQAEIPATKSSIIEKGGVSFVTALSRVPKDNTVWPINKNEVVEGEPEGSAFVPNLRDVRPFEAYVTTNAMTNVSKFLSIDDMGNNGTTRIDMMLKDNIEADGIWFTLDGRKLQDKPTKKGIYIVNGRKVVVK